MIIHKILNNNVVITLDDDKREQIVMGMVQKRVGMELSTDEAGFIALHLVNAEMEEEVGNIYELTKLMQEITNIVKYYFKVSFDEDSVYFYRFSTHLKFFCYRLLHQREVVENDDEELYAVIKKKYLNAYRCVEKISLYLNENYDYQVSNEERLYLTIHIARIVQTTEQ
ncbi:PRD domain-containing protein [Enterococcus faecalis]|uniref:PRD domain-containing protein n=1 Tax=Enterococcus faecalis TaxID=1351 RepID=UPI000DE962CE|nr:PRD domain-containing protein [Enterococcus faecalis]RBR89031.1 hypothetical protein EB55_00023 [Enterococcus faecalis]